MSIADGCGATSASVLGTSTLANLDLSTTSGKTVAFQAGATQTVATSSSASGTTGNLLVIRSTMGGSEAILNLQGSAMADFVDVDDNHATPNPITIGSGGVPS